MTETGPSILDELIAAARLIRSGQVDGFCDHITAAPAIYVYGVGRAGCIMRTFAMRLMQMDFPAHFVGDTGTPSASAGDLLIVGTGTGETGRSVSIARTAVRLGLKTIAVTATPQSTVAGVVDHVIALPGASKTADDATGLKTIQPPGSLFEQVLFCFLEQTTVNLAQQRDPQYVAVRRRHANLE